MAEEPTGTEDTGDADQAGNNDVAADGQQDESQDAAGDQGEDNEVAGLKAAATAERTKRQDIEAEVQNLRQQMAVMSANAPQQQPAQQGGMNNILKAIGIEDEDDMLTAGQVRQLLVAHGQQLMSSMTIQQFMAQHPDFNEVVGIGVGNQFQMAPPLQRVLSKNPALLSSLANSPNAQILAYEIAKADPEYQKTLTERGKSANQTAAEKAAAALEAANKKQLSVSAAKGGGNLDQAAAIAAMSDEELAAHNEKIIAQAK